MRPTSSKLAITHPERSTWSERHRELEPNPCTHPNPRERKPEEGCAPVHENGQLFAHGWRKIEIGGVVSFTGAGLALSGLGGCGSLVKKRSDEGRVGGDLGTVSGRQRGGGGVVVGDEHVKKSYDSAQDQSWGSFSEWIRSCFVNL